jgi:hypothetical protein
MFSLAGIRAKERALRAAVENASGAGSTVTLEAEDWFMSKNRRKPSREARGNLAHGRTTTRLWPVAVHWYFSHARLAIYGDVRVRQGPNGAMFIWLPELGDVRLETDQILSTPAGPGSELAAAVLFCDGAWEVLIGVGGTAARAIDELLAAIEQAFVDEVGSKRARSIAVSVLTDHPGLADEQAALRAVRSMVISGQRGRGDI